VGAHRVGERWRAFRVEHDHRQASDRGLDEQLQERGLAALRSADGQAVSGQLGDRQVHRTDG